VTPAPAPAPPRPRVLLLGCHGRLGQHLLRVLLPEMEVLGLGLEERSFVTHPGFHYLRQEGVSRQALKPHFLSFRPHAVLNCAAWTDVDGAEREREACWRGNVDLVRGLLECCRPHGVWLGHVSSDYVFTDNAGPSPVDAQPRARGVYARSKLAAENLIRGAGLPHAIFRTIVLFGKGHRLKPDFFEWALGELRAGRPIRVVTDQVGNCCWALHLARVMRAALLDRRAGIFHVAAHGLLSRHAMALALARLAGLDESLVRPVSSDELGQAAPRPRAGGLELTESELHLGLRYPAFEEALRSWLQDRAELWSTN